MLSDDAKSGPRSALSSWLVSQASARALRAEPMELLAGGAIHENWALDVEFMGGPMAGRHALVLRRSAICPVAECRTRSQEFAILRAAYDAGICVPEPLWCCDDAGVFERDFLVMRRVEGSAAAQRIWSDHGIGGPRDALAGSLGETLARIHTITPEHPALALLGSPPASPAGAAVDRLRLALDARRRPYPALEWALDWLAHRLPAAATITLVHRDFRTGNYLVNDHGLAAILDWEFAAWSDPMEDIGWFCAKCWRRGAWSLEAGGIAGRAPFYDGYRAVSGRRIDAQLVYYWEVMAHVRWAVIALHQSDRHLSGGEPGLERALLGRRLAEIEYELLVMTGAE